MPMRSSGVPGRSSEGVVGVSRASCCPAFAASLAVIKKRPTPKKETD